MMKARLMYYAICVCLALPTLLAVSSFLPDGMSDGAEI
jgi:hypothetical protein